MDYYAVNLAIIIISCNISCFLLYNKENKITRRKAYFLVILFNDKKPPSKKVLMIK